MQRILQLGTRQFFLAMLVLGSFALPTPGNSAQIDKNFDWVDTSSPRATLESL